MDLSDISDDEYNPATPLESRRQARKLGNFTIPEKSRKQYQKCYDSFNQWKKSKKATITSENVIVPYFEELSRKYKPSTLWVNYSMLKATVYENENKLNIESFPKLKKLLQEKYKGFNPTQAKTFTSEELTKFILHAPDNKYLAMKVVTIFAISGTLRTCEIVALRISDISIHGRIVKVEVAASKTDVTRVFTIDDKFFDIVNAYMQLRPKNVTTDRFFMRYENGRCTSQVIGKHKISSMPREIAANVGCAESKLYTGHAFRRTSATLLAEAGAGLIELKRAGGWKSDAVAQLYVANTLKSKIMTSKRISHSIELEAFPGTSVNARDTPNSVDVSPEIDNAPKAVLDEIGKIISLQNCQNVTIHYHISK